MIIYILEPASDFLFRNNWRKNRKRLSTSSYDPRILLFGATSIVGFNLARIYPEGILPFVTPGNHLGTLCHWPVLKLADPAWATVVLREQECDVLLYCHTVCDVSKCEAAPEWAR